MKKRVIALLLAATMVVGLTACGGGSDAPTDNTQTTDNAAAADGATTDNAGDTQTADTSTDTNTDAAATDTASAKSEAKRS